MGVTNANKTVSAREIDCGGTFDITLSLAAEPDIVSNPTDIVLLLDRSGSMAGSPLANLKSGAKKFIEIISQSTGGADSGTIAGGSHIGIVSFSTTATADTALITDVGALDAAVNALTSGGSTNHADAFEKGTALFDQTSQNARVMVMFTDGKTTAGLPPTPFATAAKAQGIIIYVIGLNGSGGIDEAALREWASEPSSAYVSITPDDAELEQIFEDLAANIAKPGVKNAVIRDTLTDCFEVVSLSAPTKGTASTTDAHTVVWQIPELGTTGSEGASFTFTVRHTGSCTGDVYPNAETDYDDASGNTVVFPTPQITVDCGTDVIIDACPPPVPFTTQGCGDVVYVDGGTLPLTGGGRILNLEVTLPSVCPGRRTALAVLISSVDDSGNAHPITLKTVIVPAHTGSSCREVVVQCIRIVLPEDGARCTPRHYQAQFFANPLDTDFVCCGG
ncbi:MAG: VWA domain-containing protein [Clostridia bacterium]|nr:VWA domain-containing protein [Clostridia bacterium]